MSIKAYLKRVYTEWIDFPHKEGTDLLGQFRIERFLGMGSYGLTYLCRDMGTGEEVVLKQAKPSKKQLGRDLLLREYEIMQRLQHPSIPHCVAAVHERKQMYMITEYVKGQTVEDLIFARGYRYSEHEALLLIRKLMEVVRYLHEQRFVHLDIRIPNVILHRDCLHLIDFGLASRIGEPPSQPFGSDEELKRKRTAEIASDLYAIGHFMLFMLYSTYEAGQAQTETGSLSWEEELQLTPATKGMLRKLLQTDAAYGSTEAFIEDLDAILRTT
ncbi:serine/threonine protein kinase [Paenibacillus sp. GCM10023248]|uniref:serine/threonine protein kinase n=1 Tax=Bacillales TaxID=1385 RepID=UPI00237929D2|nr:MULTISPECIES: protein kinase family protein [Bacillales]MDD9268158.1 protein kinase family protein [Paenibacillus sp. MAHUQ-63]MDR6879837.1 serine/threonine-protein kinase [Bacillus sp. 3255]